jgi:hypothetical protein
MKALIVLAIVLGSGLAHATDATYFEVEGSKMQPLTKVQALITKATKPESVVVKCSEQSLSDKATLKNK